MAGDAPREEIGRVLGKPVYRDEIRSGKGVEIRDEVRRLFAGPIMEKYRKTHKDEIEPTKDEIDAAIAWFEKERQQQNTNAETKLRTELDAIQKQLRAGGLTPEQKRKLEIKRLTVEIQLKPPPRTFALFMLRSWKLQRHLYDKFGGGRILWQQAGMQAFDAMHAFLQSCEKNGDFTIVDPKLRSALYEYWTTMNHGAFLTNDRERIRTEFLEPKWVTIER